MLVFPPPWVFPPFPLIWGENFFNFTFSLTEVLKQYGSRLSDYERQELEKYPEIWYLGLESCKINAKPGTPLNCGYDDENGSYNKVKARLELDYLKCWNDKTNKVEHGTFLIARVKELIAWCLHSTFAKSFFLFLSTQKQTLIYLHLPPAAHFLWIEMWHAICLHGGSLTKAFMYF